MARIRDVFGRWNLFSKCYCFYRNNSISNVTEHINDSEQRFRWSFRLLQKPA
jgi:hypothetical protein